jgi:hypothetical protein
LINQNCEFASVCPFIDFLNATFLIGAIAWRDVGNRRRFFENYAKENGFDPHDPENWYLQPKDNILAVKVPFSHFSFFTE